jgi:hypothetical protein
MTEASHRFSAPWHAGPMPGGHVVRDAAPRWRKSQMLGRISNGLPIGNFVRPRRNASDLA